MKEYLRKIAESHGLSREHLIFVTDICELRLEATRWNSNSEYSDNVRACCLRPDADDDYDHPVIILIESGSSKSLKQIRNHFRDVLNLWYPEAWDDYDNCAELFMEFLILHELGHMKHCHRTPQNNDEFNLYEQEANQWTSLALKAIYQQAENA